MFSIVKKYTDLPIAPLLKTDMHSHILPGIDDGAQTVNDSLTLIDGMIAMGYEQLVATPHIMADLYKNTPQTIHAAYLKLKKKLDERGYTIPLSYAAEYLIDEDFENKVEAGLLHFAENIVLVETMFSVLPPNIDDILFFIETHQYHAVLAHPERYHYMDDKLNTLDVFQKHRCYLQPNILSFAGYYGPREKFLAEKILDAGLIDFLGTDMHHPRHLKTIKHLRVRTKVAKKLEEIVYKNRELVVTPPKGIQTMPAPQPVNHNH